MAIGATHWAGRWAPRLFIGCAIALIPWVVYLQLTLPRRTVVDNYRGAWVGFDVLEIVALARTGWMVYRRDPRVVLTATAAGVLLVVDAWFDVLSAHGRGEQLQALASAIVLELPGATLCLLLARRALARIVALARGGPDSSPGPRER